MKNIKYIISLLIVAGCFSNVSLARSQKPPKSTPATSTAPTEIDGREANLGLYDQGNPDDVIAADARAAEAAAEEQAHANAMNEFGLSVGQGNATDIRPRPAATPGGIEPKTTVAPGYAKSCVWMANSTEIFTVSSCSSAKVCVGLAKCKGLGAEEVQCEVKDAKCPSAAACASAANFFRVHQPNNYARIKAANDKAGGASSNTK